MEAFEAGGVEDSEFRIQTKARRNFSIRKLDSVSSTKLPARSKHFFNRNVCECYKGKVVPYITSSGQIQQEVEQQIDDMSGTFYISLGNVTMPDLSGGCTCFQELVFWRWDDDCGAP